MVISHGAAIARLHFGIVGGPRVAKSSPSRFRVGLSAFRCTTVAPALLSRLALSRFFAARATSGGKDASTAPSEDDNEDSTHDDEDTDRPLSTANTSKWMIVGLGNPGSKYVGTRHNVGFEVIDLLAAQEKIKMNTIQCKALVGRGKIHNVPVLLVKPQTYMNLSGDAVAPLALYYRVRHNNILLIYDDMNLDVAEMKLKPKGGGSGHNGVRHIFERLKNDRDVPRLRIGIGRPTGNMDGKAYVLQKFTARERLEIEICYEQAADGVRLIMSHGIQTAISKWNPPKRSRDPSRILLTNKLLKDKNIQEDESS